MPRLPGLLLVALSASPAFAQFERDTSRQPSFPSADNTLRTLEMPRFPLFFPPNPPPLDRPVGRGATPGDPRLPPAPPELAAHVNEIFYPALGARLATNSLKPPLRRQLDTYRATKLSLQNELRTELARLQDAEPAARAEALATLARNQAPRLAQLELDAEQLRRDLMLGDHTWSAQREWRLGHHERRGFSPLEIAQVMRSYAFYQAGLLPAQRRLLREIAIELLLSAESEDKATAAQPHVFFPPEPARVLFPENMSAEAAAKLAAYQTQKSLLKKELYDEIYKHDGAAFAFLRGTIGTLATKQAPRLAALEALAEDVRRLLPGARQLAPPPERPPVPVAVADRVTAMMDDYAAAQKDAATRIDAIVAAAKQLPFQSVYRFEADGLKFQVVPTRFARGDPVVLKKIEAVRADVSAVAEDYGRKLAVLLAERTAIITDIGAALGTTQGSRIEAALISALRAAHQKQNAASYDEYRIAVFEAGLSPAQRRLLFDGVVERLEMPLPRGELQPTRRRDTW